MYRQSRGGAFGNVSARIGNGFLPENYSGNAFRREETALDQPSAQPEPLVSGPPALLPVALPEKSLPERETATGPLSFLGNILSGDSGLLLLVLLILAAGGGKSDDGALIMILLLLCL